MKRDRGRASVITGARASKVSAIVNTGARAPKVPAIVNIATIARLTFQEAFRRRLVLAVAILSILFLGLFTVGFSILLHNARFNAVGEQPEVMNFFLLAGLYAVNFLVVALTVLASVDTVAGEITAGTLQTVVTKPVRRWEVLLGKWIGLASMIVVFTAVLSGSLIGMVRLLSGYQPAHAVQGVALMMLEGWVLLSISLLGGTRLSTLANGVVVFMLYAFAFIAGWLEQIAFFIGSTTLSNLGIAVSLLAPTEALWRRAAWLMQPPSLQQLGFSPFASGVPPSAAMVVWAVVYAIVAMLLAIRVFSRRDL